MFDILLMMFDTLHAAKSLTVCANVVLLLTLFAVNRCSPFRDLKFLKLDFMKDDIDNQNRVVLVSDMAIKRSRQEETKTETETETVVDMLSYMPQSLQLHILSFLDAKHAVVETSMLSKSWMLKQVFDYAVLHSVEELEANLMHAQWRYGCDERYVMFFREDTSPHVVRLLSLFPVSRCSFTIYGPV
ncbi:hypothetical protein QVD17_17672 [Tagetes erecta]|uniref:F-box domain-containing protein n=1 Tax=Tagetes erecta TaxID=13708 RepID=A0AAD8KYR7_TARER|nr:hypothetical protein QVD17_17672 [Tagetes erecta]